MPEPTLTTARSPHHSLPFLFSGQAQKEAYVNEALVRIDALIQPVVQGEASTPPANPSSGDSYIVATNAGGAWQGRAGEIATWADNQWLFAAPRDGARVHDAADGALAVFREGSGWHRAVSPPTIMGGSIQDVEARAAIGDIVAKLHSLGIFSA